MDVSLVMFKADGTRRDFPMSKAHTVLGRTNRCDLRIPLSSVSRRHCEILVESNEVLVRDLGSSNGTFVNNSRVQEKAMTPGDELVIGPVVFTLVVDGKPDQIKPVKTIVGETESKGAKSDTEQQLEPDDAEDDGVEDEIPLAENSDLDLDDPIGALDAMANEDSDELPELTDLDEPVDRK